MRIELVSSVWFARKQLKPTEDAEMKHKKFLNRDCLKPMYKAGTGNS
jgi:hypothetical protein